MLIKEIKKMPSKKVKVTFLDADEMVLYQGEVRKYHLTEGGEIPEEIYQDIHDNVLGKRAKKRAMHLLEKMDRTESNLRDKLRQNDYPEDLIDAAVDYVKRFHYIDDLRYAKNYIHYHQSGKSAGKLKMDLLQKGVAKELIEQALAEEFEMDETEMIRDILEKKRYFSEEKSPAEQRRIYQYLLRRGYKSGDILRVMKCDDYLT